MSQPLSSGRADIESRLVAAHRRLLLIDYDGTLTPIVDRPDDARLSMAARSALAGLAANPGTSVAILSGRALADLRDHVGLDTVIYAGNHGLEVSGPALAFTEPNAGQHRLGIHLMATTLATQLAAVPGVQVEDKGLTLSVHVRHAAVADRPGVLAMIQRQLSDRDARFVLTTGKMVYEIRPRVDWNKGTAARWLFDRLDPALAIVLGDDQTDEDMFRALPEAVCVKVGDPNESAARYFVESPDEVVRFLEWIGEVART